MRNFIFLFIFILCSCDTDDLVIFDIPCSEENCGILNPFGFSVTPANQTLILNYGPFAIIDAANKVCFPDAIDFYISETSENFKLVERVEAISGSLAIEDLEDGKAYFIKMVNLHCELDSIVSPIQSVTTGEIVLPELIDNGMIGFEDFRLSPEGDQFIYRTHSNDWYLSSLSNPLPGSKIIDNAFYAEWNPNSSSEISFVQQTRVDITSSLQGITSKSLMTIDPATNNETVLHEIEHLNDFSNGVHKPEQYWIHEFHYAINSTAIYFTSNKDNGSSSSLEKKVFNNIWKLDLITGSLEALSDFLPIEFEINDFIEDPNSPENFYITGATYGETIPGGLFDTDRVDIHYYNSMNKTITPILMSDHTEKNIGIDPQGENIIFTSDRTGRDEIWSFNLSSLHMKQITNRITYSPTSGWHYVNWISDTEFMTYVKQDENFKFATFNIE